MYVYIVYTLYVVFKLQIKKKQKKKQQNCAMLPLGGLFLSWY